MVRLHIGTLTIYYMPKILEDEQVKKLVSETYDIMCQQNDNRSLYPIIMASVQKGFKIGWNRSVELMIESTSNFENNND
jgi:hypothetical protein